MASTYEMLSDLRPVGGHALLLRFVPRGARLCAVAGEWEGFQRSGQDAAAGGLSDGGADNPRNRQDDRPVHDRPRVGRHPRAEHAAAALVALDLLRDDHVRGRAIGSSIPRGRWSAATPVACSATPIAARSPRTSPTIKAVRGATEAGLDKASVTEIVADKKLLGARARARQGGLRRELRAVPRLGRAGRQGLSQPHQRRLAVGRQARRDPDDDHPRHSRRLRQGHAHERDAGVRHGRHPEAGGDQAGRQLRAHAEQARARGGRRRRRRQEDFRRQLRGVPRRRGQGQSRDGVGEPHRRRAALRRQTSRT